MKRKSNDVDAYVGQRLRLRRVALNISQEELSSKMGITFQQIQKYERGINRVSSSRLYDFARVLLVSVSYFFEGFDGSSAHPGFGETEATPFEREDSNPSDVVTEKETLALIRQFSKITNPRDRKRLLEIARAFADDKAK